MREGKPPVHCESFRTSAAVALVLAAGVATPAIAEAQFYEGARLLGYGQAQRALMTSNDAIYINPAGLAMSRQYVVESGYVDDFRGSDRRFNGSVIDTQAGPLAGGLAYTYSRRRPDNVEAGDIRLEGHRIDVALASVLTREAAFGMNVRYLNMERSEDGNDISGTGFGVFNIDAGFQYRVNPNLSVGLVGYNLVKNDRAEMPIQLGGGVGLETEMFTGEVDLLYDFQVENLQVSFGGGLILYKALALRGGGTWDQEGNVWSLSVGAGFFVRRLGIDLGYRQALNASGPGDDADDRVFAVTLRAQVF